MRRSDDLEGIGEAEEPAPQGAGVRHARRDLDELEVCVAVAVADLHVARLAFGTAQAFTDGADGGAANL